MELWIAYQWKTTWELAGIFSSRSAAEAACVDDTDGVAGPFLLDVPLPRETFSAMPDG